MNGPLNVLEIVGRLLFAILAGGAMGWERQAKDKPAGLRTHMLVALGSATFVLAGIQLSGDTETEENYRVEMSRIMQGVIGGIGFLGAGTIIQSRGSVRGITTAASVWVVAAIGVSSGLGHFYTATLVALVGLLVLHVLLPLERRLFPETMDDSPPAAKPSLDESERS